MPLRLLLGLLLISIAPPAVAQPAQVSAVLKRANTRFPLLSEAQIRTAIDGYLQRQKATNGLKCVPTGIRL
jgi:hypothetical protein